MRAFGRNLFAFTQNTKQHYTAHRNMYQFQHPQPARRIDAYGQRQGFFVSRAPLISPLPTIPSATMAATTSFGRMGAELDQVLMSLLDAKFKLNNLPTPHAATASDPLYAEISRLENRKSELEAQLTRKSTLPPCYTRVELQRYVLGQRHTRGRH